MTVKTSRSEQCDYKGLEILADAFTLSSGATVGSATNTTAINALASVTSANAGATYTSAEQTLINELKTKLNAVIAALQTA